MKSCSKATKLFRQCYQLGYIFRRTDPSGPPWTQSWVPTGSLNRGTTTLFRGGGRGKASFFPSEEDNYCQQNINHVHEGKVSQLVIFLPIVHLNK